MTLEQIRNVTTKVDLMPAIKALCDNMVNMTYGEFQAYKRTLETRALFLGLTLKELNDLAEDYQQYGKT